MYLGAQFIDCLEIRLLNVQIIHFSRSITPLSRVILWRNINSSEEELLLDYLTIIYVR